MSTYSITLFLHIVSTLGFFVALGLEWTGLSQMQSAAIPEQVRPWLRLAKSTRKLGMVSMLLVFVTGFYMLVTIWGGTGWLIVTLGALVLGIALTLAVTGPRMMAVTRTLMMEKGSLSQNFHALVNQPLLWISIQTRIAIALGIIFLKIAKPDLGGSLITIGVAIALGFASAQVVSHRGPAPERSGTAPIPQH